MAFTPPWNESAKPADESFVARVLEIAEAGGRKTLDYFAKTDLEVDWKEDGSPVTAADKAAERVIRDGIDDLAPNSSIVGEEEGYKAGGDGLTWYVDPIDGTKGFTRGVPLYATLVAVNDEWGPLASAIHIPATGEAVWAGRGCGAFTHRGRATVSSTALVSDAWITTSSVKRWGRDVYGRADDQVANLCGWGDGYGFLMVAEGRIDAMVDLGGGSAWDFAPMPVIMHEAGGRFSDLDGSVSFEGPSGVASNGLIHDDLLKVVNG